MKIIDAHQHFWDIEENYLPWLADKPVNFRYGDYSKLRQNYLPDDYRRDNAGFDIIGSVFIETEWDPSDPLGEVRWVEHLRKKHQLPTVMVAQAWLDQTNAEEILAAHGKTEFVRGIRHKPTAVAKPQDVEPGMPGSMGDPAWRRGYGLLAQNGLSFDLQTPWWHLREALELAEAFPDTQIILNHSGLPSDRSPQGLNNWRDAMKLLATAPNAAVKISGLGMQGTPWRADDNKQIVLDIIDIFGTDRAMFASNFPVDSIVGSFDTIYSGFLSITQALSESEQDALFFRNAAKFYTINLDI